MSISIYHVRTTILDLVYNAKVSHIACDFSCAEIVAAMYSVLDLEKIKTQEIDRDRIVLSKGHAVACQLAVLCELGLFEHAQLLGEFCLEGSKFPENTAEYTPYIENATGSLGQGLSYGFGVALGMKMRGYDSSHVYVLAGDGELNEGQIWEAVQQSAVFGLGNLTILVDDNGLAGINKTRLNDHLAEKFTAFGFDTYDTDGHDLKAMIKLLNTTKTSSNPKAIICHTIKGKGVSFMENNNDWHYRPVSDADYQRAMEEIRTLYEK